MDTPTVHAAAAALGVQAAQIIKTLLFLVKDEPVLVIASGDTVVDRRPLAGRYGVGKKQVKLADPEAVMRVTGCGRRCLPSDTLRQHPCSWMSRSVPGGGLEGGDDHTLLRVPTSNCTHHAREWIAFS
jgi:hypothetical protein